MKTDISIPEEYIKHEIPHQNSEIIIKPIVDKLITLSVRRSYANKINSELGKFCFNFMKKQINYVFESYFIEYTRQPVNKEINKNEISWKNKKPKRNTWVEITEPEYFPIDRYEGSCINFKEIERKEERKKSNKNNTKVKRPSKSNFSKNIGPESHRKSIRKTLRLNSQNFNKMDNVEQNDNNKNPLLSSNNRIDLKQSTIKIETNGEQNTEDNNPNSNTINNTGNTKAKRITMIEYPFEDIPNIEEEFNFEKYDIPNIEILRKDFEESLIKKEQERKRQKREEEKARRKKKESNEKKVTKLFDSNRLTFDSNGKIISFRPYRTDNLKDFFIPKNFIKDLKKHESIKTKKTKKITLKNEEQIEGDIIKNIQNTESDATKGGIKSEKIIPSGSNFKLISPDIGVTIRENDQFKEGPKDFSKHFNKYSLNDYNKILNEYLPDMNRNMFKEKVEPIPVINSQKSNILNNNKVVNNDNTNQLNVQSRNINELNNVNTDELSLYNPLISSTNKENNTLETEPNNLYNYKTISNPNNNYLSSKKSKFNNSVINTNPLLTSYNNNLNTTNYDKTITVRKGLGSLKLELDSLKDLNENYPTIYKNSYTTRYNTNIIGDKFRIKNNSLNKKYINYKNTFGDFNKNILTNQRWGNEFNESKSNKSNTLYSKHQTKTQILRELGSNILSGIKIKLPRNRKVDLTIK